MGMEAQSKVHHRAKTVIDERTGKKYISTKEAAKDAGCSPQHLRNQLNGNLENKTSMEYEKSITND